MIAIRLATTRMADLVDLIIEDPRWQGLDPPLSDIATQACELALGACDLTRSDFEISLLACDDARIRALNGTFRDKDSATNVLSWPAADLSAETPGGAPAMPQPLPHDMPHLLGDIAIAYDVVAAEAEAGNMPITQHLRHLIVHATLHLLGYDHENDADALRMEDLERKTLVNAGFPDPY